MKITQRVRHDRYGPGTIQKLDGKFAIVMFDRDVATKAPRRVWKDDLTAGAPFYEGVPTPPASGPALVA